MSVHENKHKKEESVPPSVDSLIKDFARLVKEEELAPSVLSEAVMNQLEFTYECMKYLTRGYAKVTYELCQPVKTMGVVTVEGSSISIAETEWFARALEFASNVEIYPLLDGNVRMEFTFHGLTKYIRPEE